MNYIIVSDVDFEEFVRIARDCAAQGQQLSVAYVSGVSDVAALYSSHWGCVRFSGALPAGVMFPSPAIEYRYSADADAWLVNGQRTEHSDRVKSLYQYFLESPWGQL